VLNVIHIPMLPFMPQALICCKSICYRSICCESHACTTKSAIISAPCYITSRTARRHLFGGHNRQQLYLHTLNCVVLETASHCQALQRDLLPWFEHIYYVVAAVSVPAVQHHAPHCSVHPRGSLQGGLRVD